MEPSTPENPESDGSPTQPNEIDSAQGEKGRKRYTMSKQREVWSEEEHQKFLEALRLFDRDWKQIEKFIGTKTVIQIRSHAQKYFLKVQKNPSSVDQAHIPPPRAKRKSTSSSQSQKKIKDGIQVPWMATPESVNGNLNLSNPILNNSATFAHWMASNGLLPAVNTNPNVTQIIDTQKQQQEQLAKAQTYFQQAMSTAQQKEKNNSPKSIPNFVKIYAFIANLFNPEIPQETHLQEFQGLSPLDQSTVQLLMHNLTINIANEQFQKQHLQLLDQFKQMTEQLKSPDSNVEKETKQQENSEVSKV